MEVRHVAPWGFDLHVVTDLFAEEVTVVGGEDDRLDLHIGEYAKAPPQVVQHAIHLAACLRDVVRLAEFVDLLRGDQHQIRSLDAIPDLLGGLRQEVIELGVVDGGTGVGLEEGDPVLAALRTVPATSSPSLPPPTGTTFTPWLALGTRDAMPISVIVGIVARTGRSVSSKSD